VNKVMEFFCGRVDKIRELKSRRQLKPLETKR